MDLFITKWEIIDGKKSLTILGFTSDGICIRIPDFRIYVFAGNSSSNYHKTKYKFLRGNKPAIVQKLSASSSSDLNRKISSSKKKQISVFESDISPMIKFFSDKQIDHIGWVHISKFTVMSDENKITTCKEEYVVSINNLSNANDRIHAIPEVKLLSFDIECYSQNRGMSDARNPDDVIFMISMVFTKGKMKDNYVLALKPKNFVEQKQGITDYKLILYDEEFGLLDEFFAMIRREDPDVIIGYNIMGFDMKYILQKYYSLLKNIPQAGRMKKKDYLRDEIIHKSWNSSAYGVRECVIFNFVGRCCFDVYNYVSMELTMQKYSLDFISQELLGRQKLDMSYNEMFSKYRQGKVVEIADYCFIDSDLTLGIWEKLNLWIAAVEQCKLFKVDLHDMYSSGQQKRIFNQLYFYAHKKNYVFDKEQDFKHKFNYQGAYVLDPKPGIYKECAVIDFASLYPSIIISQNICYTTQVIDTEGNSTFTTEFKGVIPEILEHLIMSRKQVKKLMKQEEDVIVKSIYDKRQFAYKVSANSFYGAFGSRDDHYLQMRDGAEAVTKNGRLFLMKAVDIINTHELNCTVIYGDTDSCFFSGIDSTLTQEQIFRIVSDINVSFPPPVHVEFEKMVDVLLLLAKKKYVFVSEGKQIAKGVITARRDNCLWVREVYKSIIDYILDGKSNEEVNSYLSQEMKKLYMNEIGMDKLYINRNLGINYKSKSYPLNIFRNILQQAEKRNVPAGERLEFYYIRSNNKLQGYHYASKSMIKNMDLEIDREYYVDHQLKGPILQIYDVLGWKFCF